MFKKIQEWLQALNLQVSCGPSSDMVIRKLATKRNRICRNFDLCEMSSVPNKACCKFCGNFFFVKDANSTLKNHIQLKHCKALKQK
ncbi:putative transcription factor/ chromatin remodeling BED-type(Zn) family [Helianthus annuus]|nr:putative transcription factor/ chromatin remodeling BED-type(Zn) family [Helianthus annuus]